MPKVSVRVPHHHPPQTVKAKVVPVIEKTVNDFEGKDVEIEWHDMKADFRFKSLAFTITGNAEIAPAEIRVDIDLPFAAIMYKDRVEKGVTKNLSRVVESLDNNA